VKDIELILTDDGSHSLRRKDLDETYHSTHGAIRESEYVFIQQGLQYIIEHANASTLEILEVGFGTGLNAFLTALHMMGQKINCLYTTLEPFPLTPQITQALNYPVERGHAGIFNKIHRVAWETDCPIHSRFGLHKKGTTLQDVLLDNDRYHLVYFDAFAPSRQLDIWHPLLLKKVFRSMKNGGALVTYSARGQLKRDLRAVGFEVETLPGPPPKIQMVRALRIS